MGIFRKNNKPAVDTSAIEAGLVAAERSGYARGLYELSIIIGLYKRVPTWNGNLLMIKSAEYGPSVAIGTLVDEEQPYIVLYDEDMYARFLEIITTN
jgi:hypothetical protein